MAKDNNNIFGKRLKQVREDKGLTQQDIGNIIDSDKALICLYEKGSSEPGVRSAMKIANFLGVSLDWLIGETEDRSPLPPMPDRFKGLDPDDREQVLDFINYLQSKKQK